MASHNVRQQFIDYFKKNGHEHVKSSSVVPDNDPTLLFTNAGMNQFKNVFLGLERRSYSRAVTAQKCVRAGGKHNDLDNVGFTARHHTFFEMLGNFSFGDYFKKDAIHFAWDLVTREFGLDRSRLYVSVFEADDEAAEIWRKQEGVPSERIFRFGEASNFWRMGDSGPCGPCSEIFYDLGPEVEGDPKDNVVGGDGDRFIEFWNLVFMQYEEDGKGGRKELPKPSVDTGMGLERLSSIVQGELSNYHTVDMMRLIDRAAQISGLSYEKNLKRLSTRAADEQRARNVAFRVLADHARAAAFMMADGVMPSNEGRGYVLRRIMRRAIRYGRNLCMDSLFPAIVGEVIDVMGVAYPELRECATLIRSRTRDEEERFLKTLDHGIAHLTQDLRSLEERGQRMVPGDLVFKLYDTFGFPTDLTRLIAKEKGFSLDEAGFDRLMEQSKEVARASWKAKSVPSDLQHLISLTKSVGQKAGPTRFDGYAQKLEGSGRILKLSTGASETASLAASGLVLMDQTCFYAEGGGQVGDTGRIVGPRGAAAVLDTTKLDDVFVHHVQVIEGSLSVGDDVQLLVDRARRTATARHHSATHLLHAALRTVLGETVSQAGSLVDSQRLRFDFSLNRPMSREEVLRVETLVNAEIDRGSPVITENMSLEQAKRAGAIAMFGEKYAEAVRVLTLGPTSKELCGGTHVDNTAHIRLFKIVSESGVSAGVRRIEALAGDRALAYLESLARENHLVRERIGAQENWQNLMDTDRPSIILSFLDKQKETQRELQRKVQSLAGGQVDLDKMLQRARKFNGKGSSLLLADVDIDDRQLLSDTADRLRDKIQSGIVVLVGRGETSHPVIVTVSKDLLGSFSAGSLLRDLAQTMGGKGGGRSDFAQGAVPDRNKLAEGFATIERAVGVSSRE